MPFNFSEQDLADLAAAISLGVQNGLSEFEPNLLLDSLCKPFQSSSSLQHLTRTASSGTAAINALDNPVPLSQGQETLLLYYAWSLSINDGVGVPPTVLSNLGEELDHFCPVIRVGQVDVIGSDLATAGLAVPGNNPMLFSQYLTHAQSFLVGANEAGYARGIIPILRRVGPGGTIRIGFSKSATVHSYRVNLDVGFTNAHPTL
jgi:hypothetical protein